MPLQMAHPTVPQLCHSRWHIGHIQQSCNCATPGSTWDTPNSVTPCRTYDTCLAHRTCVTHPQQPHNCATPCIAHRALAVIQYHVVLYHVVLALAQQSVNGVTPSSTYTGSTSHSDGGCSPAGRHSRSMVIQQVSSGVTPWNSHTAPCHTGHSPKVLSISFSLQPSMHHSVVVHTVMQYLVKLASTIHHS